MKQPDWYERRNELAPGMVFNSCYGIVKLDGRTAGDGSKWDVLSWCGYWANEGATIEPGDLEGQDLEDTPAAIAKATGVAS